MAASGDCLVLRIVAWLFAEELASVAAENDIVWWGPEPQATNTTQHAQRLVIGMTGANQEIDLHLMPECGARHMYDTCGVGFGACMDWTIME